MAAVDDCASKQYWNGTHCVDCSKCPRGFGVFEMCTSIKDTKCERCWAGFDYSNTSSYEKCIGCDEFSNCLSGNPKRIKNCTRFSPHVCDGCEDGYYVNSDYADGGRCVKCRRPCETSKEDETRPCRTEHNRICTPKAVTAIPPNPALSTPTSPPASTQEPGTKKTGPEPEKSSLEGKPLVKKPWFWVSIFGPVIVVFAVILMVERCRRRQKRRRKNTRDANEIPMRRLLRGFPVRDLEIEKKKCIARMLDGKDPDGYFYWQRVAEKLGLGAECKAWEGANHPTNKLLSAYGELEGSSVQNLAKALREAGLTYFASEVEKLVPSIQQDEDPDDAES